MTMFHFLNCAILTFGPHAVYYSATPLSEYDTLGTSVRTALVYLGTALVKLVCLATFLKVSDSDTFDPYQADFRNEYTQILRLEEQYKFHLYTPKLKLISRFRKNKTGSDVNIAELLF